MTDKKSWHVTRLDDVERRGRMIPAREHLGIHAFGFNAFVADDDGLLINEHDEAGSRQEELYVVLDGHATFEIDGETVEAPAGTLVAVAPEARRKATGEGTVLAFGGAVGEVYQSVDWGEAWPMHNDSIAAYGEQRYDDALATVREALEHSPDHPALHFNYACFAAMAGDTSDETFDHLHRSIELSPQFRDQAKTDSDFDAIRDDPRFEEALR
jgi:hypothetical protein